jgi:hypothetical protein
MAGISRAKAGLVPLGGTTIDSEYHAIYFETRLGRAGV